MLTKSWWSISDRLLSLLCPTTNLDNKHHMKRKGESGGSGRKVEEEGEMGGGERERDVPV